MSGAVRLVVVLSCVGVAGAALSVHVARRMLGLVASIDGAGFLALIALLAAALVMLPKGAGK